MCCSGAADTFRAAADQQLQSWADRVGVDIVAGQQGADPASVAFDAFQAASARGADVVIVDTAGRLQSQSNLMDELAKVARVLRREAGDLDEVLLVIDGTTGQNAIAQAQRFAEAVAVTGIVLTKLDGTARGGVAVAIEREMDIPVKFIGIGEGMEDLIPFKPAEFVAALLGRERSDESHGSCREGTTCSRGSLRALLEVSRGRRGRRRGRYGVLGRERGECRIRFDDVAPRPRP